MKNKLRNVILAAGLFASAAAYSQIPLAWGTRYNAPPDQSDEGRSIAVDNSGFVYVTGTSMNSNGNFDITTVKYSPSGSQVWAMIFDRGLGDNDRGSQLVLDANANVYVVGTSRGNGTADDIVTIKYDSNGSQQWVSYFNGTANGSEEGRALAVNSTGDVFVCGVTPDAGFINDGVVIKYNSSGTQQWAQLYNGTVSGSDEFLDLEIDASSNVYLTGNTETASSNFNVLTIKYNSSGAQQWLMTYDGTAASGDYGKSVTLDNNNNVIVAAQSFATNQWMDILVIKYSNSGSQLWTGRYNHAANRFEDAWDVKCDAAGFIYVAGQGQAVGNNSTPPDCVTLKYSPSGGQVWVKRWDGGFNDDDDRAYCLALDDTANVYIGGYSRNGSNLDYITIKYDSSGTEEFALRFNSQYNRDEQINAIAVKSGNIYVTGTSGSSAVNSDYLTLKYSYSAVGISENNLVRNSFTIMPVPAEEFVQIVFHEELTEQKTIEIADISGKIVATQVIQPGSTSASIDISALSSGLYLMTVRSENSDLAEKSKLIKR
jgi:hypothetical protein